MPARKETIVISHSAKGWVVMGAEGRDPVGPYSDRENAIATALQIAKESRPRQVKVSQSPGNWSVECFYQ